MPLEPTWPDIGLRLLLTFGAAALVGLNREVQGHAAGLRTAILIALAASIAMISANLLLAVAGKAQDSFVTLDLMRLPLGILTGVGFIGGGAILRRGNLVSGVTTAATLWMLTVIGLCFGADQLTLGAAATALAVLVLWALKWFDLRLPRHHRAMLVIVAEETVFAAPPDLDALVGAGGYQARLLAQVRESPENSSRLTFEIRWIKPGEPSAPLDMLRLIERAHRVERFELIDEGSHWAL
jgi:putative Mg2+ transporter-C (MgtC) family protein